MKKNQMKPSTHLLLVFMLGPVHIGERVRSQNSSDGSGPLHRDKFVFTQQNLSDVVRSHDAHRGVAKEMRSVNASILLPFHPQELSPLQ